MNIKKNHIVEPDHGKKFLMDYHVAQDSRDLPLVIFVHGIKGFKEWGTWNTIAEYFAENGFIFTKFNFSHNGTTLEKPDEFDDLEAFGRNNYMLELADLEAMVTHCTTHPDISAHWDQQNLALIGHSRGGPVCLVKSVHDNRITQLVTWAAVRNFDYAWHNEKTVADWKRNGVMYRVNSRTKIAMPLYYQLYTNYLENKDYLDAEDAAKSLDKPWLIVHGTDDDAVSDQSAKDLQAWSQHGELALIESANHTFGGVHPFTESELPALTNELIEKTILFLKKTKK